MDRSRNSRDAAGVRFVTEPDGTVTAEHVESGSTGTGETAVEALTALYETTPDLEPPADAGFGTASQPRESSGSSSTEMAAASKSSVGGVGDVHDDEWEWVTPVSIEPRNARGRDDG